MPVIGQPRLIHGKFKFVVEIDDFQAAFFTTCSELAVETEVVTYREGGALIPIQEPGLATFPAVTLTRGTSQDQDFHAWMLQVVDASAGIQDSFGENSPTFKRNLSIVQRDRDNTELLRYNLFGVWPSRLSAGDWDNSASEVVIESLVLQFDFFQRVQA